MEVVWDYFKTCDSLLPHVVTAFKELGFTVTAEGIETQEMADTLTAIGCDHLQGYLFDRPLPIDEFVKKYSPDDKVSQ
jgi:EAL domain-containing protein (putative c-di-GMP-specific phosphodiesterase class I)